jgi:hypothetical protein
MQSSLSDYMSESYRRHQTTDLLYEGTVIGSVLCRFQQIVQNGRNDLERFNHISTATSWMRDMICSRRLRRWLEGPAKQNRLAAPQR